MNRLPGWLGILLTLVLVPSPILAHGTEWLLGQSSATEDGALVLHLDLTPRQLAVVAGVDLDGMVRWGDLRRHQERISTVIQGGLHRDNTDDAVPERVFVRAFAGAYPPADVMLLPDRVVVEARWRPSSMGSGTLPSHLELSTAHVLLVVDPLPPVAASQPALATVSSVPGDGSGTITVEDLAQAARLGFAHVLPSGFDHVLFVTALATQAASWSQLGLLLVTFTGCHGLALLAAAMGILPTGGPVSGVVELGIAASIVGMALLRSSATPGRGWYRFALVGAFGLVHGCGFATVLAEYLSLAPTFLPRFIAVNLGIEAAHGVVAVAAFLAARQQVAFGRWQSPVRPCLVWAVAGAGTVLTLQRLSVWMV